MEILQGVFQLTLVLMFIYLVIRAIYMAFHGVLTRFFSIRFEAFTAFVLTQREDDDGYILLYFFPFAFWWYALPHFLYHRYALKDTVSFFDVYGMIAFAEETKRKLATRQLDDLHDASSDPTEVAVPRSNKVQ